MDKCTEQSPGLQFWCFCFYNLKTSFEVADTNGHLAIIFNNVARSGCPKENNAKLLSKSSGKTVAVILNCFEFFVECPSNLQARAMTWSNNYKHHNTIKILLAITLQGVVSFVSSERQILNRTLWYFKETLARGYSVGRLWN